MYDSCECMQLTIVLLKHFAESQSPSKARFRIEQFQKFILGWDKMRIDDMNDAQDHYEFEEDSMGENVRVQWEEKSRDSPRYCRDHEEPKGGVAKL